MKINNKLFLLINVILKAFLLCPSIIYSTTVKILAGYLLVMMKAELVPVKQSFEIKKNSKAQNGLNICSEFYS